MQFFKKKHIETDEQNLSYIYKCDEISDITEIVVGSLFDVSVSEETEDVIISIAKIYENHLLSGFDIEDHITYKTAKLYVTLSGRFESTGKDRAAIILPKSKLNLDKVELSGAVSMVGGNFNAISSTINISGAAALKSSIYSQRVIISASGASNVSLNGSVHRLNIDASGSSIVYAGDVDSNNAVIEAHGAAKVLVNPSDSATGHASGASTIQYAGNVKYEDIKTSGAAIKREI